MSGARRTTFGRRRGLVAELTLLGSVGAVVLVLAIRGDWYEILHDALQSHELFNLDDLVLTMLVVTVVFALLSVRRWVQMERRESERDRALWALESERDFSTAVLDTVSSLVLVLDRDGRVVRFNRACERASGFAAAEVVGRPFWELLIPPEDVDAQRQSFHRLVTSGGSSSDANPWIGPQGTLRLIEWTNTVVAENGSAAYVVATGRDVTEERRAHEALARTEQKLEGILESIEDFVWSQDALTREMLYVSPSVERIYGFSPEAMKANTRIWLEVIHPDDRERVASYLPALTSTGRAEAEYRIVREDGSIRWVHDKAWAVRDASGAPVRFDGIVRDVTGQKHLEEQFRQSQKMEAVGLLAGGIAHDFNNLLTAIGGYAELLGERLDADDPRREHADAIRRAAARAASLTRQLLAFSRRQVLQPRVFGLNALLGELLPLAQRLVGEHVRLELDPAPALGDVRADPGQIEQVVMNLVVNARDAMPGGGRIAMATSNVEIDGAGSGDDAPAPGSYVALTVTDDGDGMDEAVRGRIFEPFFTTKPMGKGTGLGLSTVYGIVRQSGGAIEVDSAPGVGTTFRVLLPRHSGASLPDTPALLARSEPPSRQETVLVVEDEPSVRELACEILAAEGYRVLRAADGREAIEVARRHADSIRLVVTDVVMPRMGGLELAEHLRDVLADARVVFMSGFAESIVRGDGSLERGDGFLPKPFAPADLLRQVREALDRAARPRD